MINVYCSNLAISVSANGRFSFMWQIARLWGRFYGSRPFSRVLNYNLLNMWSTKWNDFFTTVITHNHTVQHCVISCYACLVFHLSSYTHALVDTASHSSRLHWFIMCVFRQDSLPTGLSLGYHYRFRCQQLWLHSFFARLTRCLLLLHKNVY